MSVAKSGANNSMYGKVAANAMTIDVYDLDNVLVRSFSSKVAAAKWLNTSRRTVSRYIESGKESEQSISLYKVLVLMALFIYLSL